MGDRTKALCTAVGIMVLIAAFIVPAIPAFFHLALWVGWGKDAALVSALVGPLLVFLAASFVWAVWSDLRDASHRA